MGHFLLVSKAYEEAHTKFGWMKTPSTYCDDVVMNVYAITLINEKRTLNFKYAGK